MMKSRYQIAQPLLKHFCGFLMKMCFSLEVQGMAHLSNAKGPVILAGNHTGYLDSLILLACVDRPFSFMMDEVVFRWGFIGKLIRYGNISQTNTAKPLSGLKQAIRLLKKGQSICIFPEGKLSTTGEMDNFNQGAAYLQKKSGVTILPFAIMGGFDAWPYGQKWPKFKRLAIWFGEPLEYRPDLSRSEVTQSLRQEVERLQSLERGYSFNASNRSNFLSNSLRS